MEIKKPALASLKFIANGLLYVSNFVATIIAMPIQIFVIPGTVMLGAFAGPKSDDLWDEVDEDKEKTDKKKPSFFSIYEQIKNRVGLLTTFDIIGLRKSKPEKHNVLMWTSFITWLSAGFAFFFLSNRSALIKGEENTLGINSAYQMWILRDKPYQTPQEVLNAIPVVYNKLTEQKLNNFEASAKNFEAEGFNEIAASYRGIIKDFKLAEERRQSPDEVEKLLHEFEGLNLEAVAEKLTEKLNNNFPKLDFPSLARYDISVGNPYRNKALHEDTIILTKRVHEITDPLWKMAAQPLKPQQVLQALQEQIKLEKPQASVEHPETNYWRKRALNEVRLITEPAAIRQIT